MSDSKMISPARASLPGAEARSRYRLRSRPGATEPRFLFFDSGDGNTSGYTSGETSEKTG